MVSMHFKKKRQIGSWKPRDRVEHKKHVSCHHLDISKNRGTPKSSILIGSSIINHDFWGTPILGNTHLELDFSDKLSTEEGWRDAELHPTCCQGSSTPRRITSKQRASNLVELRVLLREVGHLSLRIQICPKISGLSGDGMFRPSILRFSGGVWILRVYYASWTVLFIVHNYSCQWNPLPCSWEQHV